jgi:hypothetical protein
MGIVTVSSNGYFVTITVARQIVSVTLLLTQRHKNCICYIATVSETKENAQVTLLLITMVNISPALFMLL